MGAGKQRNRKAVSKRIRVSSRGKIMVKKAARNHLLQQKSKGQKHLGRTLMGVDITDVDRIKKAIPNLRKNF